MLGSLNPLGQRVRNGRYWVTASSYILSSVLGGTLIGGLLGQFGNALRANFGAPSLQTSALVLACLSIVGVGIDLGPAGIRLPTVSRQVNESWRYTYRNWVYAAGYGFQLGVGLVTIVTTTAIYTSLIAALLTGSWKWGAILGAWFGLARSVSVVAVAKIQEVEQFEAIEGTVARWDGPSRHATIIGQGLIGLGLFALILL